ncbi:MAG: hypothetical protein ACE5EH_00435 [Gammaproteobacteria bacterium]
MLTMQTYRLEDKKQISLSLVLVLFAVNLFTGISTCFAAHGDEPAGLFSDISINGYFKNETAYRYNEPRSITKLRNIAFLGANAPIGEDAKLTFSGWVYHDLAYDLFDYETISARFVRDAEQPLVFVENLLHEKDTPVAEFRELYLDYFFDNMDIRIGKQFVVWGVLDGIRIVDEVNPMDFRELILLDLLDYRIPLWTFKLDYYGENADYQFLWIPDVRFHKPAPPGSEWELLQEVPNTHFPKKYELINSEFGVRMTRDFWDTEFTFSYMYTWDDFPVVFRQVELDSSIDPVFIPTFTRINIFGSTFIKQLGKFVVKGELAFVPDKYFGLGNDSDINDDGFLDNDGELKKQHIRWGLGIDFNIWGIDFSPAISQWVILDYDDRLLQDRFDTSFALFIRKPLPQKSAVFQLLMINLINLGETYIKPKVMFDITDQFQIATGLDLLMGKKSQFGVSASTALTPTTIEQRAQFFGNFHDNDRVFIEFKYAY